VKNRSRRGINIFRDIFQIFPRVPGHDFDALPSKEDTISFLRDLSHTGVINPLNDVVIDKMHQPWRTFAGIINRSLSGKTSDLWSCSTRMSPEMKKSKAYKTYLGYATGAVSPKVARKFKKASPSKKESIVVREPPVETKSKGKEKEKVDVAHGKGIELLSETHPSGSGTVAKKPPSVEKITPTVTSKGTGDKPGVPDVIEDDSTESESESWGNDEDDNTRTKANYVTESDEDKGMDDTTNQFDDDVGARLEEPT
ncbi:hypothetical protein Tco_1480406, partial [Tanacetum coccineum]